MYGHSWVYTPGPPGCQPVHTSEPFTMTWPMGIASKIMGAAVSRPVAARRTLSRNVPGPIWTRTPTPLLL